MSRPDDEVIEVARAGGLLPPGEPVVVLLSGGRDSVCLLDVALRLTGAGNVRALHVNYGLREAADADERHCRGLCVSLDVPLRVEHPRRTAGNVQAWARDVRYRAAERDAARDDARVAVAHTASDQAETILYRLAASPGRRALLGMSPREGAVVRPLLGVTREQTAAYCTARGLRWREDESNVDRRYARARVREALVPALRAVHPAAEANVVRTAALLRDEAEVLASVVEAEIGPEATVEVARLAGMAPALARLVVLRLAEDAAGRPAPDAARRTAELIALGERRRSASLNLEGGLTATIEDGRLGFVAGAPHPRWRRWRAQRGRGAWRDSAGSLP